MAAYPSSPTPGNYYSKYSDDHPHEPICISITYMKLYKNSIKEYVSFCNLLFLLNTVKLIQQLGDAADAGIHPLGPCLISATATVGSSVPAQVTCPGPPIYRSTHLFLSFFVPAGRACTHTQPGTHASIMNEMEGRGVSRSLASPGAQFWWHFVHFSEDPSRTEPLAAHTSDLDNSP